MGGLLNIAYLDVETSGLLRDPEARVVEWALSVWEGDTEVFRGESLVSGNGVIPEAVTKINGITMEMTVGSPTFKELYVQWREYLQKAILVAHNLSFDLGMINRDLIRQGEAPLGNPGIDSLALFRRMKPDLSSYKLTELVRVMGVLHDNPHRAMGDVDAMRGVLGKLFEKPLSSHDEGVLRMWCGWGGTSAHRYQKDLLAWARERDLAVMIDRSFPGGFLSWGRIEGKVTSLDGEKILIETGGEESVLPLEDVMAVQLA